MREACKKYAVPAGVNEPKKSCHGARKARAEVAAYADCTESRMMDLFGWTDPKMPAHYKIVAFDQSQSLDDFMRSTISCRCRRRTARERSGNIPG